MSASTAILIIGPIIAADAVVYAWLFERIAKTLERIARGVDGKP